jgi:2-keto-3-deoxy-L-rhamnonate aldolase RhmA
VGSALACSSRWNQVDGYLPHASAEIFVVVQVESEGGMQNVGAIVAIEGVEGVFFGPADLSASMGLLGPTAHPDVQGRSLQAYVPPARPARRPAYMSRIRILRGAIGPPAPVTLRWASIRPC